MVPALALLAKVSPATWAKIGAVVLIAGSFTVLKCQNGSLKKDNATLQQNVATVTESNEAYARAIAGLTAQRLKDEQTVSQLLKDIAQINEADRKNRQTIIELEKSNEAVRNYLSIPVPTDLQRVLSDEGGD